MSLLGGAIMPFCSSCGSKATDNAIFCWKCGNPLSVSPASIVTHDRVSKANPDSYKNLSIQELINLANGGDSEAMVRVGAYYFSLDPDMKIDGRGPRRIGQDWMEKAALAGHAGGIPIICSFYSIYARTLELNERVGNKSEKSAKEVWRECYNWYQLGYKLYMNKAPGAESIKDIQEFKSDMEQARYKLACKELIGGSFDEAKKLVSGHFDIPSQIVDVLVNYVNITDRIGEKNNKGEPLNEADENEYFAAIQRFKILFNDEYSAKPKEMDEEFNYAMAGKQLADHYVNVAKDYNMAFDVLNYIRSDMTNEKIFYIIDDELSHFRRNNNGELIYI